MLNRPGTTAKATDAAKKLMTLDSLLLIESEGVGEKAEVSVEAYDQTMNLMFGADSGREKR